jgi:NADPH2:quinone reductase
MVAAVRVHKPGGPEALTYEDIDIPAPGQGQIKIRQHAAGIEKNWHDSLQSGPTH